MRWQIGPGDFCRIKIMCLLRSGRGVEYERRLLRVFRPVYCWFRGKEAFVVVLGWMERENERKCIFAVESQISVVRSDRVSAKPKLASPFTACLSHWCLIAACGRSTVILTPWHSLLLCCSSARTLTKNGGVRSKELSLRLR